MTGNTNRMAAPSALTLRARLLIGVPRLFAGVGLVLRQRMRRTARRDLVGAGVLLVILLGVSGLLALLSSLHPDASTCSDCLVSKPVAVWVETVFASHSMPNFLSSWLMLYACGAPVVLMPLASFLGAQAVPRSEEAPRLQEALLTRLRPWEICLGRLLAACWPLLCAIGISGIFWLTLQAVAPTLADQPERFTGMLQLLGVHGVLLSALFMAGALGYLFASRLCPGTLWGRGAFVALAWSALCVTGIVLLDPWVQRLNNPVPLINTLLLFNPVAGVASALKLDILRTPWLYLHTEAHDYPFAYPQPLLTMGLFLTIGFLSVLVSAKLLRYAYRI